MSDEIYSGIFRVYDRLNGDIDYSGWADFVEELFSRFGERRVEAVLDLACGTGSMTIELARRGYDMTGIDLSSDMLSVARDRAMDEGISGVLWLLQDMREFELYGTVDAVVCALDSLNYLRNTKELETVFSLVNNYLYPGGVFLFDMNTPYKFENVYADNSYILEDDGIYCGWQNEYNPKTKLCRFYLSVFEECEDGGYIRSDEVQTERCFSLGSVKRALTAAGLELCGIYGGTDFSPVNENSERWYFAARKKQ
ncbi:MAG: class I SAM-dependent methyltransferase [Clostridia bacterium]|nr:class I SAM-dependent methyltransferase [Clostridia bacterium]